MGKKARLRAAATATTTTAPLEGPVPVVGGREPCPCGSGRRYKACHGLAGRGEFARLVTRPFEGIAGECDLVALREIVPSATARLTLADPADGDVLLATVLPMAWPALHRADGTVLVGLQTTAGSGDASRDVAAALLRARALEPGNPVPGTVEPGVVDGRPAPRLQELLAPDAVVAPVLHEGFDFWMASDAELTTEVRESLDRANAAVVPTRRLTGVEAAYWAQVDEKRHLRWVLPHAEEEFLDALARLHVAGASTLGEGSRFIGSFRAHGLVVPVWDLAAGVEADDLEKPAAAFAERLGEAMTVTTPLTVAERGARAGLSSRQLTLR